MKIPVKTQTGGYDITIERGALKKAGQCFNLNRKVLVVTDSGVPKEYAECVKAQCKEGYIFTFPQGETSKNIETVTEILKVLTKYEFTRTDAIVAVGGGVSGDMAGFSAAIYVRGIDFYNIPTTVLSQVDSSIGGKTAIDFMGYKNTVGSFYPPMGVLIDPDVLKTLDKRQISAGLVEAFKMGICFDTELVQIFEKTDPFSNIDEIIEKSLLIKRYVVENDEKENGMRKVLNYGHTVGHAIERSLTSLFHGECVALGMLPMSSPEVAERIKPVLNRLNINTDVSFDIDLIIDNMKHDKKMSGDNITAVMVYNVGSYEFEKMPFSELEKKIREAYSV